MNLQVSLFIKRLAGSSGRCLLGSYLCGIDQVHFTRSAKSIREVGTKWVAEDGYQWARLIEVHWFEVGGEIYVRDIGDDRVDQIDEFRSDFFAPQQGFLCSCIVHTWQYII